MKLAEQLAALRPDELGEWMRKYGVEEITIDGQSGSVKAKLSTVGLVEAATLRAGERAALERETEEKAANAAPAAKTDEKVDGEAEYARALYGQSLRSAAGTNETQTR